MPHVTDANLNRLAINESTYPNVNRQIVGFAKGKRILVTYYRNMRRSDVNFRNSIADYPTARNILDLEYQRIKNLEITLPRGYEFTSDSENSSIEVTGEALLYPNMNPTVGDVFIAPMGDGRSGIFQVSRVNLGSWRSDSVFLIKFVLQSFAEPQDVAVIESAVASSYVADKVNYLGSTAALLSEDTYLNLQKIKAVRNNLINLYFDTFWDDELCSYIRPDGIYDPHAVKFMAEKATMNDLRVRPKVLTGDLPKIYSRTIWGRLDDRFNNTTRNLFPKVITINHTKSRLGVFNTELIGRTVLEPTSTSAFDEFYIFSDKFYSEDQQDMSEFELLIYKCVTERTCGNLETLIADYLDLVHTLSLEDQYYRIPLYIHLIDVALQTQYREIDAPSMNYASTGG